MPLLSFRELSQDVTLSKLPERWIPSQSNFNFPGSKYASLLLPRDDGVSFIINAMLQSAQVPSHVQSIYEASASNVNVRIASSHRE